MRTYSIMLHLKRKFLQDSEESSGVTAMYGNFLPFFTDSVSGVVPHSLPMPPIWMEIHVGRTRKEDHTLRQTLFPFI